MAGRRALRVVGLVLCLAAEASARGSRPAACSGGRFLLDAGQHLVAGGNPVQVDAVVIGGPSPTLSVASGCPAVPGTLKRVGKATRVTAKWPAGACPALKGVVHLVAKFDASCTTLRGKLAARKFNQKFQAKRSRCGDGVVDRGGLETCEPGGTDPCDATCGAGTALASPSGTKLADALQDFDTGDGVPPDEIAVEPSGRRVARTIVEIAFGPDVTVGSVNAVLAALGGQIVTMLRGLPVVVVRIPDPGSLTGLDALVARAAAMPGVRWVGKAHLPVPNALPDGYDPASATDLEKIDHLLAVRAFAAWNASHLLAGVSAPFLLVTDFFGEGFPDRALDMNLSQGDFLSHRLPDTHGYSVLGVIGASFGGGTTDRGLVTGIFPGGLTTRAIDLSVSGGLTQPQYQDRMLGIVGATAGNWVINTSFGNTCAGTGTTCTDPQTASTEARQWIEKVRALGLENRFLLVSSAGNIDPDHPDIHDAATNNEFTAAVLLAGLTDETGAALTNITNTLVVENVVNSPGPPFRGLCIDQTSFTGGQVAAIGRDVYVLDGATIGVATETGTSFSAPEVAGLALYVWAIAPTLTPQQVAHVLTVTARQVGVGGDPRCAPGRTAAPVIDAYNAILSLDASDATGGLFPSVVPVRTALLDTDDNGRFDQNDLQNFMLVYNLPPPTSRDYGRFDLNGDGFSGGPGMARFDLDRVGSTQFGQGHFGTVFEPIGGHTVFFDETKASDLDILCYYAYSALYTGNPSARDQLMLAQCLPCPDGSRSTTCEAPTTSTTTATTVTSTTEMTVPTIPCFCEPPLSCCSPHVCCF